MVGCAPGLTGGCSVLADASYVLDVARARVVVLSMACKATGKAWLFAG